MKPFSHKNSTHVHSHVPLAVYQHLENIFHSTMRYIISAWKEILINFTHLEVKRENFSKRRRKHQKDINFRSFEIVKAHLISLHRRCSVKIHQRWKISLWTFLFFAIGSKVNLKSFITFGEISYCESDDWLWWILAKKI